MTKSVQENINYAVCEAYHAAIPEMIKESFTAKRLRNCQAFVYETENFYILKSYNTFVAVIDKADDTLYDALRYAYGYTSTSAQHIAKFRHDYGAAKWGCTHEYRFYPIPQK